jgi:hypothetical protein
MELKHRLASGAEILSLRLSELLVVSAGIGFSINLAGFRLLESQYAAPLTQGGCVKKPAPGSSGNVMEEVPSGGMPNTPTSASLMAPDALSNAVLAFEHMDIGDRYWLSRVFRAC